MCPLQNGACVCLQLRGVCSELNNHQAIELSGRSQNRNLTFIYGVKRKSHTMLDDIVQEVQALVESLVSSKLKQVQQEIEGLKRGLSSLSKDVYENIGKLRRYALETTQDSVVTEYANTLKQWTGKAAASVIYDSNVCPFTDECLFQMVKDKQNIALVATTTEGDVFGGFYTVAVTEQDEFFWDPDMFIFSFESHGRCKTQKLLSRKVGRRTPLSESGNVTPPGLSHSAGTTTGSTSEMTRRMSFITACPTILRAMKTTPSLAWVIL